MEIRVRLAAEADLEAVKPSDFSDAETGEVMPGVKVVIDSPDGERTYCILGEWDNDPERGILSSKARLAANMLGKRTAIQPNIPICLFRSSRVSRYEQNALTVKHII